MKKYDVNEMYSERLICIVRDGLTLGWCFFYVGRVWTELRVDIELRSYINKYQNNLLDFVFGVFFRYKMCF